jgi:hypothetical protein
MAKQKSPPMTAAKRRDLPASKMGLPALGKYPVDTPERAANAKARAAQALRKGEITKPQLEQVVAKANKALGGKDRPGAGAIVAKAKAEGSIPKPKAQAKKPNPALAVKKK